MLAEVADKEPTILAVWSLAGLFCILAFAFSWVRRWGVFVAVLVAALSGFVTYSWLRDPHEGPAILRELGRGYVTQAYVAGFLPCLFVLFGFLLRRQRHDAA
jgi:hypothetical protein